VSVPCCVCGRTTCSHLGSTPRPGPAARQGFVYVKPFFYDEPPQFVPSVPYIPVPPMLIGDPHGEPLYTLRPDGTIWHDGEEYASGDPW
jgi:hypothetical protein